MRSRAEEQFSKDSVTQFFGSETDSANEYASSIMISDARLVLFPVRSLTSQFKWVTCPAALQRLKDDMQRFGFSDIEMDSLNLTDKNTAMAHSLPDKNTIYLEEYRFTLAQQNLDKTIALLAKLMKRDKSEDLLKQQLVIVSNDNFSHLVQHATPLMHILRLTPTLKLLEKVRFGMKKHYHQKP